MATAKTKPSRRRTATCRASRSATTTSCARQLQEELGLSSIMQVPRIAKITLNMGVGEAKTDAKALDAAIEELTTIAGQRAQVRRARKSIASFKLREGMAVGARVTLRGARMYEFLDRLVSIALPAHPRLPRPQPRLVRRPRQLLARHPRADHLPRDRLRLGRQIRGLDVAITTTRRDDEQAPRSCAALGLPFAPETEGSSNAWPRRPSSSSRTRAAGSRCAHYTRCNRCGRPRAVFRKFGLCRICLRELAHEGAIPGMTKSSW